MTPTKNFSLGDILSVTTGRLVSRDHITGVYAILNHMTGEDLYTHQLPRACDECSGPLLAQHPQLADVPLPEAFIDEEHVWVWLDDMERQYGASLPVSPLDPAAHAVIDPLGEACDMVGSEKVFVVPSEEVN